MEQYTKLLEVESIHDNDDEDDDMIDFDNNDNDDDGNNPDDMDIDYSSNISLLGAASTPPPLVTAIKTFRGEMRDKHHKRHSLCKFKDIIWR